MKKMESKKLQRPSWLDSLFGRKNSNSQWLQENLEEMNRNFRRMLTIIGDSNAVSFAKKFEMYHESRQELINLVDKCKRIHCLLAKRYNHETGEFPNSGLNSSQGTSNVSSGKISLPLLTKLRSSKQSNAPVSLVGSRQLKRGVSSIGNNNHIRRQISKNVPLMCDSSNYYSDTQSDGDDEEEELEAELRDMIVKLYIQLEGDRVDKALLEEKLNLNVLGLQSLQPVISDSVSDYYREYGEVKESVKSELNVHSKGGLQNLQSQQRVKISTRPAPMPAAKKIIRFSLQEDSFSSTSDDSYTQSDDDDGEELQHELDAELRDMIEKLYIEMEGDRVVSMLQGGILRYEDNAHDEEFRQVRESISSNVNKALLEQNLELQAEICRLMKVISSLEEYINEESNELCESLDEALSQPIEERIEAETLFASEVEQLIVKKNNDVEELNKILEAVAAERDQLKARVAMLEADPYKS